MSIWDDANLVKVLEEDGVAVMPTDTLYGIVGRAQNASVVNRIYEIRERAPDKPCIILIGEMSELAKFSITLSSNQLSVLSKYWPGPVSVVLDCLDPALAYLHRGTNTLAFRLPGAEALRTLLVKVGPLVAPSANTEGLSPAQNISEAKNYFGNFVDFYISADSADGTLGGRASKIIRLHNDGSVSILRA
ncbi:MAG: L-threonylcarbamoyladenylate synthase [Candidatus Paceibacterales bacterium]